MDAEKAKMQVLLDAEKAKNKQLVKKMLANGGNLADILDYL